MELQGSSYPNVFNNEEKQQAESGPILPNSDQKKVAQKTDGFSTTITALANTKFPADHAQAKASLLNSFRSFEKGTINSIQFGSSPTAINGSCFSASSNKVRSCNQSTNSLNNVRADDLDNVPENAEVFTSPQSSRDSPCVTDDRCKYAPIDTVLSLSVCGYTDNSKRTRKRSLTCESPLLADEERGFSCYDPPQRNDSDIPISFAGRTSIYNNFEQAGYQLIDSYPSNLSLSISSNVGSPESILKSSAISYRNTPSIIRRKTFREAASGICSSSYSTPMLVLSGAAERTYADCLNLTSERGCLPSHDSRSGSSVIGQAVERRLEYAFDLEWDSTSVKCYTPGSAAPSSELKADKKIMLTP